MFCILPITVPLCGRPVYKSVSIQDSAARIVGGYKVQCGKYPWSASIYLQLLYLQEEIPRELKSKKDDAFHSIWNNLCLIFLYKSVLVAVLWKIIPYIEDCWLYKGYPIKTKCIRALQNSDFFPFQSPLLTNWPPYPTKYSSKQDYILFTDILIFKNP